MTEVGINLAPINYWSTEDPFIDRFKTSGAWQASNGATVALDSNGYPAGIPAGANNIMAAVSVDSLDSGNSNIYTMTYDGSGKINILGSKILSSDNGTITFQATASTVVVQIFSMSATDPVSDIHIVRSDQMDLYKSGEVFNPAFIDKISQLDTIRFMDWENTNTLAPASWDDRTQVSDARWTTAPIETMVALANESHTNMWFNIPTEADDAYVTQALTYIRDHLDPSLKVEVEYSNEVWNTAFAAYGYAQAEGEQVLGADANSAAALYYGYRSAQVAAIGQSVFGSSADARLDNVVAGFIASPSWTVQVMQGIEKANLGSANSLFSDFAVANYFGLATSSAADRNTILGWAQNGQAGIDAAFNEMLNGGTLSSDQSLTALAKRYVAQESLANTYGLNMVAYEGGLSLVSYQFSASQQATVTAFFQELANDPRMGTLYTKLVGDFVAAGGDAMNAYNDAGTGSIWGQWGSLNDIYENGSPRFDALVAADDHNDTRTDIAPANGPLAIKGTSGNDTFTTIDNAIISGGAGNDTYYINSTLTKVVEDVNGGYDQIITTLTAYTLGANVERLSYTGTANFHGIGNELDNALYGSSGNDTLEGGAGNDSLYGGAGNDILIGGAGADNLTGGTGADRFVFTSLADFSTAQYSYDRILDFSSAEGDKIDLSGVDANSLLAGNQALVFIGSAAFTKHAGELDYSYNAAGNYLLVSGDIDGDGVADFSFIVNNVSSLSASDFIGVTTPKTVNGTANDDVLSLGSDYGSIYGNAGNDKLYSGSGTIALYGGTGDDSYYIENANTQVVEQANAGTDTVYTSTLSSYTLSANVERLVYTGTGNFHGIGNDLDNRIVGGSGNDILEGGAGSDYLSGGAGNDILIGGAGGDELAGGTGADKFVFASLPDFGTGGALDTIDDFSSAEGDKIDFTGIDANSVAAGTQAFSFLGTAAFTKHAGELRYTYDAASGQSLVSGDIDGDGVADFTFRVKNVSTLSASDFINVNIPKIVNGTSGNDRIVADGDATVYAGAGNDTLVDGTGIDTLYGGAGDDTYYVSSSRTQIFENANEGADTVATTLASYTLGANIERLTYTGTADFHGIGNALDNTLSGSSGNDTLEGGAGNDYLYGGAGNDILIGGAGADNLTGGTGADRFVFTSLADFSTVKNSYDRIWDFSSAEGDKIDLSGVDANSLLAGTQAPIFIGSAAFTKHAGELDYSYNAAGNYLTVSGDTNGDGVADFSFIVNNVSSLSASDFIGVTTPKTITGTANDDVLSLGDDYGSIYGNAGNDKLYSGSGTIALYGGTGDDSYYIENANTQVVEQANAGTDTVYTSTLSSYTLSANVERLVYTGTGNFHGIGNDLDNRIVGGNGNDILEGGAGSDYLSGGAGNDILIGGAGGDDLYGGAGADRFVFSSLNDFGNAGRLDIIYDFSRAEGDKIDFTGIDANSVASGTQAFSFLGTAAFTKHAGELRTIYDAANNQSLVLGDVNGDGVADFSFWVKNLSTLSASDFINVNIPKIVNGTTGNDWMTADGDVTIYAGAGNDTLVDGTGIDTLYGGAGNDTYYVNSSRTQVVENANEGTDSIVTTLANYTLGANIERLTYTGTAAFHGIGNALDNTIWGSTGNDTLEGGAGNDTLYGGAGNDVLIGGAGADNLYGGAGADTFVFTSLADISTVKYYSDRIWDFSSAEGDKIDLTGVDANSLLAGTQAFRFLGTGAFDKHAGELNYSYNSAGNYLLVSGDVNGDGAADFSFIVSGASSLSVGDFIGVNPNGPGSSVPIKSLALNSVASTGSATSSDTLATDTSNVVNGTADADKLYSGTGVATLYGGAGDDTYYIESGSAKIVEQADGGTDTVITSTLSSYTLGANVEKLFYTGTGNFHGIGNDLDNRLAGGSGDNILEGGAGSDLITGGAGNDTLIGGTGGDDLYGGAGADKFVFTSIADFGTAGRLDIIYDFSSAEGDKIDLTGVDANTNVAGDQAFTFLGTSAFTKHAGELRTIYDATGDQSLVLGDTNGDGVADFSFWVKHVATFTASDFNL